MAETTNSVSRFAAFQKQYTDNPAGFVADGRKVIKSIAKYLDGADQVKTDHKVLGIQFTVLAKEWFGGLMMTAIPTLGDMTDEEAKAFYVKAAMIGDMLTYGSGIAAETQTEWFTEVVLPENVQKAKADEEAAQVAKAKANAGLAKAFDATTTTPVETATPDVRAWVVANYPQSVDGEIEAGISLATDFLKSEGRLPANAAELDQYAEPVAS